MINESGLEFSDISSEKYRLYIFPDAEEVRIENPRLLSVSKNGHRVFSADGLSHYIPKTWLHLVWEPIDGGPNFVK